MFKTFAEKYLSSAAFIRDANNDTGGTQKTEAQLARESIQVDVGARSDAEKDATGKKEGEENNDNKSEEDGEDAGEDDEDKEDDDDDNGQDDNKENETPEQKEARLAQEKETRRQARIQKRIDRLSAENKNKDAEIERLKAQLKEQPVEGLTEEEVERRAAAKADQALKDKANQESEADFNKRNQGIYQAAMKADKDFDTNVQELAEEIGGNFPRELVYVLSDLDNENGGEVLSYLAQPDNIEDAAEILKLPPTKMMNKIIRISDKLKEAKKAARKKSAVAAPITPVGEGNNRQRNVLPPKPTENMDEYVRIRNEQAEAYRKSKGR